MLRTYKGRYENGQFIFPEKTMIPDAADIIITILDDSREYDSQRTEKLKKIFEDAQEFENNLSDEEWAEFENLRSQTKLSRGVEKWFTP